MHSLLIYAFCIAVSWWASMRFFSAWKKWGFLPHREFGAFFLFLGIAFVLPFLLPWIPAAGELINFTILIAFSFVIRAALRFQGSSLVSPGIITGSVLTGATISLAYGLTHPPTTFVRDGLIYWGHAPESASIFGALLLACALATGIILLSNLKNVRSNKKPFLFLGVAFLLGGVSGSLITNSYSFTPLASGYGLLFVTFILVLLFVVLLPPSRGGNKIEESIIGH